MIEVKGKKTRKVFSMLEQGMSKEAIMAENKINSSSFNMYNYKFRRYMEESRESKKQNGNSKIGEVVVSVKSQETSNIIKGEELLNEVPMINTGKIQSNSFIRVDGVAGIISKVEEKSIHFSTVHGVEEVTAQGIKEGRIVEVYCF